MKSQTQKFDEQLLPYIQCSQQKNPLNLIIKQQQSKQHKKQFHSIQLQSLKKQFSSIKNLNHEKQNHPQSNASDVLYFSNSVQKISIPKPSAQKKQQIQAAITKVIANGKISAVSDNEGNLWLLGMIFPFPINIVNVVKKKIIDGFLGQKGIIIKTKKKFYVINWDKIAFPTHILNKIEIQKKYAQYFQCWQEKVPYRPDAWFLFSSKKDSAIQTIFYHVFTQKLIIYPYFKEINIGKKIKGISASKTHTLCWTQEGKIFSWGQKSLALGYTDFSEQIQQKQIVNANFHVISAVAGIHYSVALSVDGKLYQWGIKNIFCPKSQSIIEEFIFVPKQLQIKFDTKKQKICCLKGNEDHFGVITFSQRLYVWGKTIPRKLIDYDGVFKQENDKIQLHSENAIEPTLKLLNPTFCKCSLKVQIVDFQMRQDYVFLVTSPKNSQIKNQICKQFWCSRLKNISNLVQNTKLTKKDEIINNSKEVSNQFQNANLFQGKNLTNKNTFRKHKKYNSTLQIGRLSNSQSQQKMQKYVNQLNKKMLNYEDKMTKVINERLSKQKYFESLTNQQSSYRKIMEEKDLTKTFLNPRNSKIPTQHYMIQRNTQIDYSKAHRKARNKTQMQRYSEGDNLSQKRQNFHKRNLTLNKNLSQFQLGSFDFERIENLLKNSPVEQEKMRRLKFYENIKRKQKLFRTINITACQTPQKQFHDPYALKLTQVLLKKESLNLDFFQSTVQKIERSSLSYRKKQSEETAARKQREQRHNLLKQTLFPFVLKHYLIKSLTSAVNYGRQIKIKIFVSNLKYNRIQKSVRRLFQTTRIRFNVHDLKQYMPKNFLKLVIVYKNFVRKWRANKKNHLSKYCVEQMIKLNVKNKIKVGLHNLKMNTRNLQKIGSWLQLSKQEKMKCLNQIWKKHISKMFEIEQQYQIQYNTLNIKNQSIKSFQQLYLEKIKHNPMLKIQNYLGVSPLFKVKMLRNCEQSMMQMLQKKQLQQIECMTQKHIMSSRRNGTKHKIKFRQQQQQKIDLRACFLNQNLYLLPYSKHSSMFKKPKNLEINIAQNLKDSQRWAQEQKKILIKIFSKIIKNDHIDYQNKMYKYRRQMALFIRDNYSKICQKRWKYIIEYNQRKKQRDQKEVDKKQKQLRKLLRTIGCQNILNNDILPEKYKILDEAKQMKGVPQIPQKWMNFGVNQFKKVFKEYIEALQGKTKSIKRIKQLNT